jgi:hypothetical protein
MLTLLSTIEVVGILGTFGLVPAIITAVFDYALKPTIFRD